MDFVNVLEESTALVVCRDEDDEMTENEDANGSLVAIAMKEMADIVADEIFIENLLNGDEGVGIFSLT